MKIESISDYLAQKRGFTLWRNSLQAMGGEFSLFYENVCSRIAPSSSPSYSDPHFSNFSKKIFTHIHFHLSISFSFFGEYLCLSRFFSIFLVILFSFNGSFCFPIFIKALYLLGFLRSIVFHIVFHIIYMVFHMISTYHPHVFHMFFTLPI